MVFGIVILLMVGAIAYFHYAQGFFSALLSAICAVLAGLLAFSYHETIVESLLKGKIADFALGATLLISYMLFYVILRQLFDRMVPGNVRVPLMVDKIGAASMGIVAGLIASGIFALAAQSMPFGPSLAGYTRWTLMPDRPATVNIPGVSQAQDMAVNGELRETSLDPAKSGGLFIPVDDFVVGLVNKVSDNGSLMGERSLASVHPDFVNELFGIRLGVQTGTKHTAMNLAGQDQISLQGVYTLDKYAVSDGELKGLRSEPLDKIPGNPRLTIVRLNVGADAQDDDHKFRFSSGAIRLVAGGKNYHPVGTVDTVGGSSRLFLNKPDDFQILEGSEGMDLAFVLDPTEVLTNPDPKATDAKIKDGVFVEVKRLARVDLGGKEVKSPLPASGKFVVLRKPGLEVPKAKAAGSNQPAGAEISSPLVAGSIKASISSKLFTPINTGNYQGDTANVTLVQSSGTATVSNKKFTKLDVNTTASITILGTGEFKVDELGVPDGKKLVQISGSPSTANGMDPWEWADKVSSFELVDSNGKRYRPQGAWAKISQGTASKMFAKYDIENPVGSLPKEEGRPMDAWIVFLVDNNTQLTELQYNGQTVKPVALEVK